MRRQQARRSARCDTVTAAMKTKTKTTRKATTIGIDLGDRKHSICVLDQRGEVVKEETITNTRASLDALSGRHRGALVVMEVGMHSPWTSRYFKALGHRVLVANPRKVRAIYQNDRKSDRRDAEMLARIARSDEKLLHPVEHRGEDMQRDLLQIKLRDNVVRQRVDIISSVRFTLKSLGPRKGTSGDPRNDRTVTRGPRLDDRTDPRFRKQDRNPRPGEICRDRAS